MACKFECIFYTKEYGIDFKQLNGKLYVSGQTELVSDSKYAVATLPQFSQLVNEANKTDILSDKPPASAQPVVDSAASIDESVSLEPVAVVYSGGTMHKVMVECVELFGPGVKKLVKLEVFPDKPVMVALADFSELLNEKFQITTEGSRRVLISISYRDHDLDGQSIQLDDESWSEFIEQKVKFIIMELGDAENSKIDSPSDVMSTEDAPKSEVVASTDDVAPVTGVLGWEDSMNISDDVSNGLNTNGVEVNNEAGVEPLDTDAVAVHIPFVEGNTTAYNMGSATSNTPPIVPPIAPLAKVNIGSTLHSINTVRVVGLEPDLVAALLKQQGRPIVLEFVYSESEATPYFISMMEQNTGVCLDGNNTRASLAASMYSTPTSPVPRATPILLGGNKSPNNSTNNSLVSNVSIVSTQSSPAVSTKKPMKDMNTSKQVLPYSLFIAKFNHSLAAPLRTQVKKYIADYLVCDWFYAVRAKTGSPQITLRSIYKYVEATMQKAGLFDNTKSQGGGVPEMTEDRWNDIRDHIEVFLQNSLFRFTMDLSPILSASDITCSMLTEELAQGLPAYFTKEVSLQVKLASLRFLTLKHFGLQRGSLAAKGSGKHKDKEESIVEDCGEELLLESWRYAAKEFCKAAQQTSPMKMLEQFVIASNVTVHVAEAYLNYSAANSISGLHLLRSNNNALAGDNCQRTRDIESGAFTSLSADEILPAISWTLTQANPPTIDALIWMCTEFRHPDRLSGEQGYCLAQLSSALEYCRIATVDSLDIRPEEFVAGIKSFNQTQMLIDACKRGEVDTLVACLRDGADVNGLTPDQTDAPISMCIRNHHQECLQCLLGHRGLVVNLRLSPCHGRHIGYTPLHLAAEIGNLDMVLLLLRSGADRYIVDGAGQCPVSLVTGGKSSKVKQVLRADPNNVNLLDEVAAGNLPVLEGLVLQEFDVNVLYHENSTFPLMIAVLMLQWDMVECLVTTGKASVNMQNCRGATALMLLSKLDIKSVENLGTDIVLTFVNIFDLFLDHGYRRDIQDNLGLSALDHSVALLRLLNDDGASTNSMCVFDCLQDEQRCQLRSAVHRIIGMLRYNPNECKIFDLSKEQNHEGVQALIDQKVSTNTRCPLKGFTPLIAAVFNKDIDGMKILLTSSDIDINRAGSNGMTPLHYAAQAGDRISAGLLLKHGAEREGLTSNNQTALEIATANSFPETANVLRYDPEVVSPCLAAKHGDWNVLSALLVQGTSINMVYKPTAENVNNGPFDNIYTPLISACAHLQHDVVTRMIDECDDLDVNMTNAIGETALMYASREGDEDMVLKLLRRGANRYMLDRMGRNAKSWAVGGNHTSVSIVLSLDPAKVWVHDLVRAANFDGVVALFKQGVDPNMRRFTDSLLPSVFVADNKKTNDSAPKRSKSGSSSPKHRYRSPPSASDISTASASVPSDRMLPDRFTDGEIPITVAATFNCLDVVSLISKSPDSDINLADGSGRNAIWHASFYGHIDLVALLLSKGASRKSIDFNRQSATDAAISKGHLNIAALLEADPYLVHIHDACQDGKVMVVSALLMQKCPVNFKDERAGNSSQTPLHAACGNKKVQVVKLLLNTPKIDVDEVDALGRTALMLACQAGDLDCTSLLLAARANRNLKDVRGKTASDYARGYSYGMMLSFMGQKFIH